MVMQAREQKVQEGVYLQSKVQHDSSWQQFLPWQEIAASWHVNDWQPKVASVCLLISTTAAAPSSSLPVYPPLPPLQAAVSLTLNTNQSRPSSTGGSFFGQPNISCFPNILKRYQSFLCIEEKERDSETNHL